MDVSWDATDARDITTDGTRKVEFEFWSLKKKLELCPSCQNPNSNRYVFFFHLKHHLQCKRFAGEVLPFLSIRDSSKENNPNLDRKGLSWSHLIFHWTMIIPGRISTLWWTGDESAKASILKVKSEEVLHIRRYTKSQSQHFFASRPVVSFPPDSERRNPTIRAIWGKHRKNVIKSWKGYEM